MFIGWYILSVYQWYPLNKANDILNLLDDIRYLANDSQ